MIMPTRSIDRYLMDVRSRTFDFREPRRPLRHFMQRHLPHI